MPGASGVDDNVWRVAKDIVEASLSMFMGFHENCIALEWPGVGGVGVWGGEGVATGAVMPGTLGMDDNCLTGRQGHRRGEFMNVYGFQRKMCWLGGGRGRKGPRDAGCEWHE